MSENLGEFFSLIGKAKKEKEDEFRSLVGDLDIDSMFSQVKESINEDKKKKKKEEKQIQKEKLLSPGCLLKHNFKKRLKK